MTDNDTAIWDDISNRLAIQAYPHYGQDWHVGYTWALTGYAAAHCIDANVMAGDSPDAKDYRLTTYGLSPDKVDLSAIDRPTQLYNAGYTNLANWGYH